MIYDDEGFPCVEISLNDVVDLVHALKDVGWIGGGTVQVPQRIQPVIPPRSQTSKPVSSPVLPSSKTRVKRRRKSFVRRIKVWVKHKKHRLRKALRSLSRSKKRAGGSRTRKNRGTRISCGSFAGAVRSRSGVARLGKA